MIRGLLKASEVVKREKIRDRKFLYEPLVISGRLPVNNTNMMESLIIVRKSLGRLLNHFGYDNKAISMLCGFSISFLKKIFVSTDVSILDVARISARFSCPISIFVKLRDGSERSSVANISPSNFSANLRSRETWEVEKEFRKEIIELINISCQDSKSELKKAIKLLGLNSEAEGRILSGYYWAYDLNILFSVLMYVANVRLDFDFSSLETNIGSIEKTRSSKSAFSE